jgi:hypothetical protein
MCVRWWRKVHRQLIARQTTPAERAECLLLRAIRRAGAGVVLLCVGVPAFPQNFTGGFNFYLPPADTTNTRFLPSFPVSTLTDLDFVTIDANGHFSVRGSPMRFFGANLVADGAFPTESKSWFIAGRLRKMGFNLVRFHHLDNPWSTASLFEQGWTTRLLNPATLDRLEKIISELKYNGIYADINLHVSRTFTAMDGLPDTDSLQEYGKGINFFDPVVLALHKEFASQLLGHVNPYTGKPLAGDPVMAMVELTNENSLYRFWRDGRLKHISKGGILTARHVLMLDSLWLAFLGTRYSSTSELAQSWNAGAYAGNGINTIVNGTFESAPPSTGWVMEIHSPASATVTWDSTTARSGKYSARVNALPVDGTDWHLQFKQIGLSVALDSTYVVSFAARADSERTISAALMRDIDPWNSYGSASFRLTPQWQMYAFSVHATEALNLYVRLSFSVGAQAGSYWLDDVSVTSLGVKGLLTGESLDEGRVSRIDYADCPEFTDARVSDISSFYLNLENSYYDAMRSYLRDSLGVRVPIVGTNWNVGPADIAIQSKQDYIDNHAYWDHPSFPGIPWSSTDWTISNTSMIRSPEGGATVGYLFAGAPVKGKPFTVSEYNHPFPNRFQTEAVLFLTSYGAFHDASGLMFFDYNSLDDWETDVVAGYFSIHRNSVMMALMPSCASAFREGMVSLARQTLVLDYSPVDILTAPRRDNGDWTGQTLVDRKLALKYGVRSGSFESGTRLDPSSLPAVPTNPFETDTREIRWDAGGLLSVTTPRFIGESGFLDSYPGQKAGPLTISTASGFGTVTWVSLTADSLRVSRQSLLTVSSATQNSGMIWDGTTTVHDKWGGSPTQVFPLHLTLGLELCADSIRVYPLDPSGDTSRGFSLHMPSSPNLFHVNIDQSVSASMWYGIEAFGQGSVNAITEGTGAPPTEYRLSQNYPNPFNPTTAVSYQLSAVSDVKLVVYDILGREVAVLVNERKAPGKYEAIFNASDLASGVYLYRIEAGRFVETRRMILMK